MLDQLVTVTMEIISEITGFPKDGLEPSHYFKGKRNDKILDARIKNKYVLQHDGWVYHVDIINDLTICIGARVFGSKTMRMNRPN